MATNNKPATALPWEYWESTNADDPAYNRIDGATHAGVANIAAWADGAQDAAYIVHAANAYPELVAALRACIHNDQNNMRAGSAEARALLAKLGE